jgi:uncharacterized protein YndB with AHSA1/START domain
VIAEVRIERVIDAPRDEVFRAWTDPDELRRWWGPGEYATRYAEIDLRPGGDYLLVIEGVEGDDSPDPNGYRMGWESGLDKLAATVERS